METTQKSRLKGKKDTASSVSASDISDTGKVFPFFSLFAGLTITFAKGIPELLLYFTFESPTEISQHLASLFYTDFACHSESEKVSSEEGDLEELERTRAELQVNSSIVLFLSNRSLYY